MRRDKDATRKNFLAAIERIKSGTITNKELKARKSVKLNRSTVEKETGLKAGALRHYKDITDIIDGVSDDGLISNEKYEELKNENKKLKKDKGDALKDRDTYKEDADNAKSNLNKELSAQHQLVTALFYKVPIEEREELMKAINNKARGGRVSLISDHRKK